MARVFINYRRDETAGEARALFTELRAALGADSVFMDVDNIALGRDFRQVLSERLESVDLMVTLIGKEWLQIKDASGRRRLDDANDFVRREIRAALERNIAVIPLLLQGAHIPAEADLPEDIRSLAFRNGFEISHARWNSDVHELLERLGLPGPGRVNARPAAEAGQVPVTAAANQAPAEPTPRADSKRGTRTWLVVGLLGLVIGGGFAYYRHVEGERVRLALAQADAEKQRLLQETEQAKAAAVAASEAAAQAQQERERAEAEAKERAAQAERDREAAEQLARKRAAEKAAQDRAEKDKAAREQAAKELAAKEQAAKAQAAREQAAREQAAKDEAAKSQAEREAAARAAKDRRIAAIAKGQFTGSIAGALGDYAEWRRMPLTDLNDRTASPACGKWSEQIPPDEARNFRASCLMAARDYATFNLRLGARPSVTQWTSFCEARAQGAPTDVARSSFIATCTKYR